jgi:hypothetical protein
MSFQARAVEVNVHEMGLRLVQPVVSFGFNFGSLVSHDGGFNRTNVRHRRGAMVILGRLSENEAQQTKQPTQREPFNLRLLFVTFLPQADRPKAFNAIQGSRNLNVPDLSASTAGAPRFGR